MWTGKKTRIYSAEDLKPGDVLVIIEVGQRKRRPDWPLCNFRRICVVSETEKISDGRWVFHHRAHYRLSSVDGSHRAVVDAVSKNRILINGQFGCNHDVHASEVVFRLDGIVNTPDAGYDPGYNRYLYKNPGFDLINL